jgi:hypothetical protein
MIIADSVYQSTFISRDGSFEFLKLCSTIDYKFKFYYLGYEFKPHIQKNEQDENHLIFDYKYDLNHFVDSISRSKEFKLPDCETYEYCGLPAYSDRKLKLLSYKYGFIFENRGCYYFDEKVVNKEVIAKLNKSLGDNWEEVFMKEVESKLKLE